MITSHNEIPFRPTSPAGNLLPGFVEMHVRREGRIKAGGVETTEDAVAPLGWQIEVACRSKYRCHGA